jgi:hypothetical protein
MISNDNDHFDPDEWLRRLESDDRSDPLLALAANIKNKTPDLSGPASAFQTKLRSQLVDQFAQQSIRRPIVPRWLAWGLAALAVISLVFIGVRNLPGSTPSVSAAEIINLASQRITSSAAQDGVLYDRLLLDWDQGGSFRQHGVVAELWRSADGSQLRYQMYAGDRLLYFDQHDNDTLWRSSHLRPVEGKLVDFVYQAHYKPEEKLFDEEQQIAQLLFRDLGNFWVYIDQLTGGERADCANPFCVLSALGDDWACSTARCTLNLDLIFDAQDLIVEARVLEDDWLSNGHQVHQVRLQIADVDDRFYQILKFDTATYDLLEIEDFWRGKMHYRIRLDDRRALAWSDLPGDFFRSIPDDVEVRTWESDYPLGRHSDDRVWIISADPPPGASLTGTVTAHVELGYRLASVEKAAITIGGLNWSGHDTRVNLDVESVPVEAGEGTIEMDFVFDTSDLGDGMWVINPFFSDVMGINPGVGWSNFGSPPGIYPEWCVRCQILSPTP